MEKVGKNPEHHSAAHHCRIEDEQTSDSTSLTPFTYSILYLAMLFTQEERISYREVILANTFQSLAVVIDAMQMMGIEFENEKSPQEALIITDLGPFPEVS